MAQGGLTLVFDEHFSHKVIEFVANESRGTHQARLIHVRQRGWSGKPDLLWMQEAIAEGFVIITADRNERTRQITTDELRALRAKVILIGSFWDHRKRWERTKWLVAKLDALVTAGYQLEVGEVKLAGLNGTVR